LAAVDLKVGKSDFEKRLYAQPVLMCIYGIELLSDKISEACGNMLAIFYEYFNFPTTFSSALICAAEPPATPHASKLASDGCSSGERMVRDLPIWQRARWHNRPWPSLNTSFVAPSFKLICCSFDNRFAEISQNIAVFFGLWQASMGLFF
jgi:hypothetical protein